MSFRAIHSSDLHLGKRFGNWPEDLRGRLREARHGAIDRLAECARRYEVDCVLLAGDTFDTETPAPEIRRQALASMRHHEQVRWVVIPGNHNSLQATQLWTALRAEAPGNVVLATDPRPLALAPGVALLPAPCTARRPGRDLTEWMTGAATPEGTIRIGLAHGAITRFSEDGTASDVIPPDRARLSGLAYLALGDWHGTLAVNPQTHYSGTPEPDRFKHDVPGQALLVSIAAPGALPEVTSLPTASFAWQTRPLHLVGDEDGAALLAGLLPAGPLRRQTMLRIEATGRTGLARRTALAAAVQDVAPEFASLELSTDALTLNCEAGDLDQIDRAGALRQAAEALRAESVDEAIAPAQREIARAALQRLFSLSQAVAS